MGTKLLSVTRKRYLAIDKVVRQLKGVRIDDELLANIAEKQVKGTPAEIDREVELAMAAIAKALGHSDYQESQDLTSLHAAKQAKPK